MFSLEELPDGNDFGIIEHKAKQLITDKIQAEIVLWYQKHRIKLFDFFREEFKFTKDKYKEIEKSIQGIKPSIADRLYLSRETQTSSDYDVCEPSPTFFVKLKMLISNFLWMANQITLAGYLVDRRNIRQFRENKKSHMLMLAKEEIKNYSSKAIYEDLKQTFLEEFRSNLEQVCDNIITEQTKADQELIENIAKEVRNYQTLNQKYISIEQSCKQIIGQLLHAKLTLLSNHPCIKREGLELGRGSYSIVYLCDAQVDDREIQYAVKKVTQPLRQIMYEQLTEAVNLR